MEDRETARMRKYGESKTTRIMMATVPHVTSGLGFRKFQADGFLLTRVCNTRKTITLCSTQPNNKLPLQLRKYEPLHTQAHTPLVMEICHVSVNHKGKAYLSKCNCGAEAQLDCQSTEHGRR